MNIPKIKTISELEAFIKDKGIKPLLIVSKYPDEKYYTLKLLVVFENRILYQIAQHAKFKIPIALTETSKTGAKYRKYYIDTPKPFTDVLRLFERLFQAQKGITKNQIFKRLISKYR